MNKTHITKAILAVGTFLLASYCYAAVNTALVASNSGVQHLSETLASLKKTSPVPVIFPQVVPQPTNVKRYYASIDTPPNGDGYVINIDATPDCKGVHYCHIGSLRAEQAANPEIYYDRDNKEITVSVTLANNHKAYFTPGHAMGSYFPPMLQWRDGSVLYTLTWNTEQQQEKSLLIEMTNSAINNKT